jgi:hypothetical protein
MREMQRREQGWLIAGIQRRHKAIENRERLGYRRLVRLGLSLVDCDCPSPDSRRCGARTGRKPQPVAAGKMLR